MFPVVASPDDVIVQEVSFCVAIMVVVGSLLFVLAKEKGKVRVTLAASGAMAPIV